MRKRCFGNKDGSAMLIAMVIAMVTLVLGLTLLLISFSLFETVNRQQALSQSRELAQSVSRQLEDEITIATPPAGSETSYPLWNYLKQNISVKNNETKWPYYDAEKRGHKKEDAYRYFRIEAGVDSTGVDAAVLSAGKELLTETSVCMYWESDNTEMEATDEVLTNDAVLTVVVTCSSGKEQTTITTRYTLSIDTANGNAWMWRKE